MRTSLLLLSIFAAPALLASDAALDPFLRPERAASAQSESGARRWWKASLVPLAAANALDVHSSWGKRETNRLLSASDGSFGVRGTFIKLALQGTSMGVQYLVSRRHPRAATYRWMARINFGASALTGATAVRNYGLPRPPR